MKVDDFVVKYFPYAYKAYLKTGLLPERGLATAALETGWGEKVPANNMHGIKATGKSYGGWTGIKVNKTTTEDFGSGLVTIKDDFRAYKTPEGSFIDFAGLIKDKYKLAYAAKTNAEYAKQIKAGGYATDPTYESKLNSVLKKIQKTINDNKAKIAKPYKKKIAIGALLIITGITILIINK